MSFISSGLTPSNGQIFSMAAGSGSLPGFSSATTTFVIVLSFLPKIQSAVDRLLKENSAHGFFFVKVPPDSLSPSVSQAKMYTVEVKIPLRTPVLLFLLSV
jgi:hypothetical protein